MRSTLITLGTAWCTHRKGTGRPSDTNALSFINHSWPRDKSSFLVFLLYSCSSIFLFVRLHAGRCIGRRRYLDAPCHPVDHKGIYDCRRVVQQIEIDYSYSAARFTRARVLHLFLSIYYKLPNFLYGV